MWYNGTYACGHEGRVNVVGPGKDRQWKVERHFEGLCPDCYEKKRVEDAEKNKEEAAALGWPEMVGSERQIAWALKIRKKTIKEMKEKGCTEKSISWIIGKTDAKFWIDTARYGLREVDAAYKKEQRAIQEEQEEREMTDATILEPDKKIHPAVVKVKIKGDSVCLYYPKDDDFRKIVKAKRYSWTGCWSREIDKFSGPLRDRIVEIANVLLNEGFSVEVPGDIAEDAVNGSFADEQTRWIKYNKKLDRFTVSWHGKNDDLYYKSLKLPGAKWKSPHGITIPLTSFEELEDFAEMESFAISEMAYKVMQELHAAKETVRPRKHEKVEPKDKLKEQLESDIVIPEDLRDE
ncbi:hypothetical protein LI177_05145 [bacterium 210820-DFI.6.37]|nr:hypothetical protein [bacterium 210820-DFI.6.37]